MGHLHFLYKSLSFAKDVYTYLTSLQDTHHAHFLVKHYDIFSIGSYSCLLMVNTLIAFLDDFDDINMLCQHTVIPEVS